MLEVVARWRGAALALERLPLDAPRAVRAGPFLVELDGAGGVCVDTELGGAGGATLSLAVRERAAAARAPFDVDADAVRAGAFGIGALLAFLAAVHVTASPLDEDALASPLALHGAGPGAVLTSSLAPPAAAQNRPARASTRARAPDGMFAPIERVDDGGQLALLGALAELGERERADAGDVAALVDAFRHVATELAAAAGQRPAPPGPPADWLRLGCCIGEGCKDDWQLPVGRVVVDDARDSYDASPPSMPAKRPTVLCKGPPYTGPGDGYDVRPVIEGALPRIKACYESALAAQPRLAGKLTLAWIVGGDGAVDDARVASAELIDGDAAAVGACVVRVVRTLTFPAPRDGRAVPVRYPFVLSPGDPP